MVALVKKIGLITNNKILAESLDLAIKSMLHLKFDFFLLLNQKQAILDAEIFEINVALVDVLDCKCEDQAETISFCKELHYKLPNCKILLLIPQDDIESRKMATKIKKSNIVDDFVFYDSSLKYLLAKLSAY